MPEYFCECCNYKTNKKSSYDDHNKSKKHLEKNNSTQPIIEIKEQNYNNELLEQNAELLEKIKLLESKIVTLENENKMKDTHIQLITQQLQMSINMQNQVQPIIQPTLSKMEENSKELTHKEKVKKYTTENSKAMNIEDFEQLIKTADVTCITNKIMYWGKMTQLLKPSYYKDTKTNMSKLLLKLISEQLNKLDKIKRPIYVTNKDKNKFWIKSNNEWIDPNSEKHKIIVYKFMENMITHIFECFSNANRTLNFGAKWAAHEKRLDEEKEKSEKEDRIPRILFAFNDNDQKKILI
jgi:hypothetical protein